MQNIIKSLNLPLRHLSERHRFTLQTNDSLTEESLELEYQRINQAILITEVTETGSERPIAVAFIQPNATGVVIALSQLAELD